MLVKTGQVISDIGITGYKTSSTGGEIPMVFGVEFHLSLPSEVMTIIKFHLSGRIRPQLIAKTVIVPAQSGLEAEIADGDIHRLQRRLVIIIGYIIFLVSLIINIYVVMTEIIG